MISRTLRRRFSPARLVQQPGHLLPRPPPAERADSLQAPLPEAPPKIAVRQYPMHGVRKGDGIVRIHQERRVARHLGERRRAGRHDRRAARHRFQDREAEALPQRRQHQAGGVDVEVAEDTLPRVADECDDAGEPQRLDSLAHRPDVGGSPFSPDNQPAGPPPPENGQRIQEAEEVLVGEQVADVEAVWVLLPNRALLPVGKVDAGVVPGVDDPHLFGGQRIVPENVAARALRVRDDDARDMEDARHQQAEVVLLAWVFRREVEGKEIVDDRDLGDPRTQDSLRNRVENDANSVGLGPEPQDALKPQDS